MNSPSGYNRERLIVYQAPWNYDWLRTRAQPLAEALAEQADVVYLDLGPGQLWPFCEHWMTYSYIPQLVSHGVWGVHHRRLMPGLSRFEFSAPVKNPWWGLRLDRPWAVDRVLISRLQALRRRYRSAWLITSKPILNRLASAIDWQRIIIDVEDPWPLMQWYSDLFHVRCQQLANVANLITCNGVDVQELFQNYFQRPAVNLPNGVDRTLVEELGRPQPVPEFYRASGRSRVVYTGSVDLRLDYPLLNRLVRSVADADFYFVGHSSDDEEILAEQKRLFSNPNVVRVPAQPHSEMAAMLAHADVLLMPFAHYGGNKMFPGKLLEYLAAAKPILSTTGFTGNDIKFPSLFHCPTVEEMEYRLSQLIEGTLGLDEPTLRECRQVAAESTWTSRAEQIIQLAASGRCHELPERRAE